MARVMPLGVRSVVSVRGLRSDYAGGTMLGGAPARGAAGRPARSVEDRADRTGKAPAKLEAKR